jgi:hypothetical protein
VAKTDYAAGPKVSSASQESEQPTKTCRTWNATIATRKAITAIYTYNRCPEAKYGDRKDAKPALLKQ